MKKFLTVFVILFIVNVGCKKENVGGAGLCACSPVEMPDVHFVITNNDGADMLNPKTTGAYLKNEIELYTKNEAGKTTPVNFTIREKFGYGNKTFELNQLYIGDITFLHNNPEQSVYLKLRNELHQLDFVLNHNSFEVEKVFLDDVEAVKDTGEVSKYAPIFYLTQ